MAVNVETLEKLERKITLTLPVESIQSEVEARLRKLARTVRMDGFRPGKVPMSVVARQYGYSVQYEVMNDKVGEAFFQAADEAKLRVAGQPAISEKEGAPEGQMAFDAVFEVFPEVKIGDLASAEIERLGADVGEDAIDRTLEILRKQRRSFAQRAKDAAAEDGDRVTVDFAGKIDGEPFEGGKAEDFPFVIAEGQMLPEFENAVRGMKLGESKTFPLAFPADYHGKDVAGKTADFMVTVKKIEAAHLPEVNEQLAKSLGVEGGTVDGLRADIRKNLEREVKFRLNQRNKQAVMDALVAKAELDIPKSSVQAELDRMIASARADLKARGLKDVDKLPLPEDSFRPQAEQRVRLGLVVAELVKANALQATPEQIKAQVEELAASYEKPDEVVRYYYADNRRLADVEAMVIENNVTNHVLGLAKVTDKKLGFDELMGNQ
ncbi:MAG TPA: trigger factor [Ottowia sp.]|jgi:trigger factor|nr:trigger factor [Ottowia sp.]OJV57290.1 MAG: trigger factor [Burkholderiales bacterium 68-10]HOK10997.1 trigger factor [Ottowia sp.]HON29760.1 trigger factor [Ottowia sp.]HPP96819.1 trigger factor [Ottowia sp.]